MEARADKDKFRTTVGSEFYVAGRVYWTTNYSRLSEKT